MKDSNMAKQQPSSMIQQQLWYINQLSPSNSAYNNIIWFNGEGVINADAAAEALHKVVQRHDVLRTTLRMEDGTIVRNHLSSEAIVLQQRNYQTTASAQLDETLRQMVQESRKPFDLASGPLMRASLYLLPRNQFVLVFVFHAAVMDEHAFEPFSTEFAAFYQAAAQGAPLPVFDEAAQYSAYVDGQHALLHSERIRELEEAWRKNLESQSGVLNLPTDLQRKSERTLLGDAVEQRFPDELCSELKRFSSEQGVDASTVLLTSYLAFLFKHTNQTDITIGVPFSDRPAETFPSILGSFDNVLPVAFDIQAEDSFSQLLDKVSRQLQFAQSHREIPFQRLLDAVKPSTASGTNPVYQVAFVESPSMRLTLPGAVLTYKKIHNGGAPLDLVLSFQHVDETMLAHFEYDVNLFRKESVTAFAKRYVNALSRALETPSLPLKKLDVIDNDERQWLIEQTNQTRVALPDVRLHELVSQQAKKSPDKSALICGDNKLTYKELDVKSNQLAHYLKKNGVKKNSLVGVYLYRSTDMMVAMLAILKCGAAYVPLDPKFPENRLNYIVEVTRLPVLITQKALSKKLKIGKAVEFCLDTDAAQLNDEPTRKPKCDVKASDRAYVLFTSGSTGNPKGIAIHHEAVVNFQLSMAKQPGITSEDVLLAITTLSFDISILEMFLPLIVGATIVIATSEQTTNGEALLELLKQSKATILQGTPTTWQILIAAGLSRNQKLKILCGGESLPAKLASQLCEISDDVWNMYGPTETTIWSSCCKVEKDAPIRIGPPIDNTQFYVVDEDLQLVPKGVPGELVIGGLGVSYGYLNRPDLNETKFLDDPFMTQYANRIYRTGDLARYHMDGSLEHLGRTDSQIKLRGFRIELSEIESAVSKLAGVEQCAVILYAKNQNDKKLVAYVTMQAEHSLNARDAREALRSGLPDYMIPSVFQPVDTMPMTANGKIDRKKLPAPTEESVSRKDENRPAVAGTSARKIFRIWENVLGTADFGVTDNFFDVGGTSLLAIQVVSELKTAFQCEVPIVTLFQYPTVEKLADFFDGSQNRSAMLNDALKRAKKFRDGHFSGDPLKDGIAIVGMSGKFPGAHDLDTFFENLCNGVESISRFSKDELDPSIDEKTRNDPDYIPCRGMIDDADKFDAQFFNISPLEAQVMDPQQRVFLEVSWAALENAGYTADFPGMIGVYMGMGDNHYYRNNVLCHPDVVDNVGRVTVTYGNEKDYTAMRVSYLMNLTGPSMDANTACSSALLAVDNAFRSLLNYECDMAIAGASEISVPQKKGHKYMEGGTFTRDGHCKPFDADATGTMFSDGVAAVVLRRLEDAIDAGDTIYAVIRGTAKNNDGSNKVSFLAPSVEGQAQVITMAQTLADVHPADIQMIEAHGTGTPLGDPIEIQALTKAFRFQTDKKQYCYICSTKANIGHPTVAAGIASLIKTALCLHHEKIPQNLHFEKPNPKIDFENSPFKVVTALTPWPRHDKPRIAGISSFGFGGTNVHTIVEEAPQLPPSGPSRPLQLFRVSAKTEAALERNKQALAQYFQHHPHINGADASFTLHVGRVHHKFRDFVVCANTADAAEALSLKSRLSPTLLSSNPEIVFLFPGQGAQYVNMGRSLYESEPVFRKALDHCCEVLNPHLEKDLKSILFPTGENDVVAAETLKDTTYTQPAIFTIEYSLAQLWMHWGLQPSAMVGHSIGEFVCAVLSGVFSLEDALAIVALRGRLMGGLPRGSMLSVRASAADIEKRLPENVQLAASNSPGLCVVAGPDAPVDAFAAALEKEEISTTRLHTSHAFHSAMMSPIVEPFQNAVSKMERNAPSIPFVSTCTGNWISDDEATSAEYWARHLRMPVRFSEAVSRLTADDEKRLFIELGPRNVLTILTRQHLDSAKRNHVMPTLGGGTENHEEWNVLLSAVGELWRHGILVDEDAFYGEERRRRIPLPTYSFERKSHWLNPIIVDYEGRSEYVQQVDANAQAVADELSANDSTDYTPEQRYLTQLWGEVLGVGGISLDDNFFDLGGHSLVGLTMLSKINERFGCSFILSDIISKPTIRDFADEIAQLNTDLESVETVTPPKEKEWTPLVSLSPKGQKPPIFCVAGQGGHAMELLSLAKRLQPDIPFYGLEARGVSGLTPFETVEEMAKDQLAAIRQVQKKGPYFICGYSFGGLVAYEMALQLVAEGESIAWLGLLDTQSPILPKRTKLDFRRVQLKRIVHNPMKYAEGMIKRRFLKPQRKDHLLAVWEASVRAELSYRPAPYRGDVTLFRCPKGDLLYGEDYEYVVDDYNGWGTLVLGELKVVPVIGGHLTLVQKAANVEYLGNRIRENLNAIYTDLGID